MLNETATRSKMSTRDVGAHERPLIAYARKIVNTRQSHHKSLDDE